MTRDEFLAYLTDYATASILKHGKTLPTIATAHRAENRWNPGDPPGGSFGSLGGDNIYSFRPDAVTRQALSAVVDKARKRPGGAVYTKKDLAALLEADPRALNDPQEKRVCQQLRDKKEASVRYLNRGDKDAKTTSAKRGIVAPVAAQPGAFVNTEAKFAIAGPSALREREIVSVEAFSRAGPEERARLFEGHRPIYRDGDTVILDGAAYVVTGFKADGRMRLFRVDAALRDKPILGTVPKPAGSQLPERFASDVLGRQLHRRRKSAGDLESVSYPLFGQPVPGRAAG